MCDQGLLEYTVYLIHTANRCSIHTAVATVWVCLQELIELELSPCLPEVCPSTSELQLQVLVNKEI